MSRVATVVLCCLLLARATATTQEPAARIYHSMVSLSGDRGVFVLGGVTEHGWTMDLLDVWQLRTPEMQWDSIGALAPGDSYSASFDRSSNRIIVFSLSGETWAFDSGNSSWERMSPSQAPTGRCGQRTVYDQQSDRVILFGGFGCTAVEDPMQNDTWAYDYESDTWERMAPRDAPPARMYHAMTYDTEADRVVIWGGRVDDSRVWTYNYDQDSWQSLDPPGGPPGIRSYHTMTYDPGIDRIVLFGGLELDAPLSFEGHLRDDTWLLDPRDGAWQRLEADRSPAARSHHAAAYDFGTGQMVIYGGELESSYSGVMSREVWAFDAVERAWVLRN